MSKATASRRVDVHMRELERRDFPQVLAIEAASFGKPCGEEEFLVPLRERDVVGMVATAGDLIPGFMVYRLHRDRLDVLDFAVSPEFRRRGVGRAMAEKLVGKLARWRRTAVKLVARETELDGQLFWRAMGFRAVGVSRGHFADTGEDGFVMEYRLGGKGVAG